MERNYSVLMSVYYREKPEYLKQSIESIINQTLLTNDFVIVCDGVLTKELDAVLIQYQQHFPSIINIVRISENKGLGEALNAGLKKCKNEIVARMDSDDISFKDRMKQQFEIMIKYNNIDIVSSTVIEFSESVDKEIARRVLPEKSDEIGRFAKRRNPFNHPAVMFRKKSVINAGGYRDFKFFEDYYLWIRMLMSGCEGYNIKEPLLYMRSGEMMYERRGGINYAGQILKFRWFMFISGYSNFFDFMITVGGHMIIALIPNKWRKWFYGRALRK